MHVEHSGEEFGSHVILFGDVFHGPRVLRGGRKKMAKMTLWLRGMKDLSVCRNFAEI